MLKETLNENVLGYFFCFRFKMTYDRRKYEYFFPRKIYRCACLGQIIANCLHNGIFALSDIIDEIKNMPCEGDENKRIFCVKCGDNNTDVVFTCSDYMTVLIFVAKRYNCTEPSNNTNVTIDIFDGSQTYCCGCIRKYLREMYHYFHNINFDFNFSVKIK